MQKEHKQRKKLLLEISWTAISHARDFALLANIKIAISDILIKLTYKGVTNKRCLLYIIKLPVSWLQ